MTKYVLINDSHVGVRTDSDFYYQNWNKFNTEILFPYMEENGINQIINLGDMFDNRKRIDISTLHKAKKDFFEKLRERSIEMAIILGNHDVYLKETLEINAPSLLLAEYENIIIVSNPEKFGNLGFVPWLCKDNAAEVQKFLKSTKAEYLFGHFELTGFRMNKTSVCTHGMPSSILERFKGVYSGHFHTKSSKGNIHYLGTQSQHTWDDYGEEKGFHVFDSDTGNLEFIRNPFDIFYSFEYEEGMEVPEEATDSIVRLYIGEVESQAKLDNFIKKLQSVTNQLRIIDQKPKMTVAETDGTEIKVEDTSTIIKTYVDKEPVRDILLDLLQEAINVQR